MTTETEFPIEAPHGWDDDGNPKAPYGYKTDGTPRKSNRGAKPGQRGNSASTATKKKAVAGNMANSVTDKKRKDMLVALADMVVIMPLAGLSSAPYVEKRFGKKQATALAGDSVILSHFMPGIADGLVVLSQSKPGALSWLDSVEEKAPYLMLMQVGLQLTKALVSNHLSPNTELAEMGRVQAQMRAQEMANAVAAEAEALGIDVEDMVTA
jgi:hypothetical protein